MRIGILGDIHLRRNKPLYRLDDFHSAQMEKLNETIDICEELEADILLLPGDVFDSHTAPHGLVEEAIKVFRRASDQGIKIFVIWGQHDMRYQTSERKNTPLGVLTQGLHDWMIPLGNTPYTLNNNRIHLYGASWGEPIPEIRNERALNILVIHKQIYQKDTGWQDENDDTIRDTAVVKWGFDLVVSGDNHKQFTSKFRDKIQDKYLVNAGSLMRQSIDQIHHEPAMYLFDTGEHKLYREPFSIGKYTDVFDLGRKERAEESKERQDAFILKLQDRSLVSVNFKVNVAKALKSAKLSVGGRDVVAEIMESV